MANQEIDIVIKAKDDATKQIKNVGKEVNALSGTLGTIGKYAGILGIAGGIFEGINQSINAAKDQLRVNTQLEAVLKSTGNQVGLTSKQIQGMAEDFMKVTTMGDDVIQTGQNMLLTFTNIGKDAFQPATQALLDMATAMGGGVTPSAEALSSQAIQLGKALNDPIKGISALSRAGVTFTEQQKEQIKVLQKNGDMLGAQKVILAELNKEFGGSAQAQANTYAGRIEQIQVAIGEMGETIGTFLMPILADAIGSLFETIKLWKDVVSGLVTGIGDAYNSVSSFFSFLLGNTEQANNIVKTGEGTIYDYRTAIIKLAGTTYKANTEGYKKERAEIEKNINASISLLKARQALGIEALKEKNKGIAETGAGSLAPLKSNTLSSFSLNLDSITGKTKDTMKLMGDFSSKTNDLWKTKDLKDAEDSLANIDKTVAEIRKNEFKGTGGGEGKGSASKKADEQKKALDELKQLGRETASALEGVFSGLSGKIDSGKGKLMSMKDEYAKLKDTLKKVGEDGVKALDDIQKKLDLATIKIKEIAGGGQADIAKRLIEAQKELKTLQDMSSKEGFQGRTEEEQKKMIDLEKEIALGVSGTTQEERDKAKVESEKSQIQLIMDKTKQKIIEAEADRLEIQKTFDLKKLSIQAEKEAITLQMEQKKSEIITEYNLYQQLLLQRKVIDEQYFSLFQKNIAIQMDKTREAITLIQTLNAKSGGNTVGLDGARANGGPVRGGGSYLVGENGPEIFTPRSSGNITPNGGGMGTININFGNVSVRGQNDIDSLANQVGEVLMRQMQLYKQGIS